MSTNTIPRYPLQWPAGWPRSEFKKQSRFGTNCWRHGDRTTLAQCVDQLLKELQRCGVSEQNIVISSNLELRLDGLPRSGQAQPRDQGVAVYWRKGGDLYNIACDTFTKIECNLMAIVKTIEADRAKERYGCITGDQRFSGYRALPASGTGSKWWTVLGVAVNATIDQVEEAYRTKAKVLHPDVGGSVEAFAELNTARQQARDALGGKP